MISDVRIFEKNYGLSFCFFGRNIYCEPLTHCALEKMSMYVGMYGTGVGD